MGKVHKYEPEGSGLVFTYDDSERYIYAWRKQTTPFELHNDVPVGYTKLTDEEFNASLSEDEFHTICDEAFPEITKD